MSDLTDQEWREFDRLSLKRDLTDEEMERWVELETKATAFYQAQDEEKEREWEELRALFAKRPGLTPAEFQRYIELEDRIPSTEVLKRLGEEIRAQKRSLILKTIVATCCGLFVLLLAQIFLMGYDNGRRQEKEKQMQAKVSAFFPDCETECIAWPSGRMPIVGLATSFDYTCMLADRGPTDTTEIDFLRIEGGIAVGYRNIKKTKTIEETIERVEVTRFTIDTP